MPTYVCPNLKSGLPEIAPPSTAVLEAVVGKIMADPPKMDPTDQYKKKFRLRIKQKAQPGLPGF